jgi:hypothetical protein
MHPLAGDRIQVHGQRRGQGLALAGAHFGDLAVVQDHAADQLGVEMAHAEHALAGFAHHGKGLGQQRPGLSPLAWRSRNSSVLACRASSDSAAMAGFEGRIDARDGLRILLDQPVIAAAENLFE